MTSTASGIKVGMAGESATAAAASKPVENPRTHDSEFCSDEARQLLTCLD